MPEVTSSRNYGAGAPLTLWSPDAGALFFPLNMPVAAGVPVAQSRVADALPPSAVELRLRDGRSLHFESTIDPTALSVLIRAVEAA